MANEDLATDPAPFAPLFADARVQFVVAGTDPQRHPTSGIVRTHTMTASWGSDDAVKSAAAGGSPAWPAERYLNLWVCELSESLLGYAQFPGGPAGW